MRLLIFTACLWHATFAAPQFVTFKDGKIGVNFGGYHADAGLGGLLTGNAAHGGLSASAGTPWGPRAAAGLGGRLDGRTSGVAYAGAEANPAVGASALLGGSAGEYGIIGSEAHANGKVSSNTITNLNAQHQVPALAAAPVTSAPAGIQVDNGIQKIRPPKKYTLLKSEHTRNVNDNIAAAHSKHLVKSVYRSPPLPPPPPVPTFGGSESGSAEVHVNSGIIGSALQIPIGILRSLQESLGGLGVDKRVSYQKNY